jgi:hypothetical protein
MKHLPVDERGYPVPWFVHWQDGKPDFRVIGPKKMEMALMLRLCWVCGGAFTNRRRFFTVGPMCTVNRVSGEPPSHEACAVYAAMGCPFLARPHMQRRENDLPEERVTQPGHIEHNPGVAAVWKTQSFKTVRFNDGMVFKMGDPDDVAWYCMGRLATRGEVVEAISRGLPKLIEKCEGEPAALLHAGEQTAWVMANILPGRALCSNPKGDSDGLPESLEPHLPGLEGA